MSILSKITTGKIGRAQKCVIYTPEGLGKSTLASLFPDPLFADVEESTSQLDVRRLGRKDIPDLKTYEAVIDEIVATKPCKSFVTDTIDWLEEMAAADVCATHKVENIEEVAGGFGKGYNYLTARMSVTLAKLDRVVAAGIHVVLLAHSSIVRFDPPDGAGAFDRYELKLYKDRKGGKGTASLIKEWADMLIFGNWRTQVAEKGSDKNKTYKGVGGKERILYCSRSAAWDAKNRHGLADVEPWGKDASEAIEVFKRAFRAANAPWGDAPEAKSPPVVQVEKPAPAVKEAAPEAKEPPAPEEPKTGAAALSAPMTTPTALPAEVVRICEPHSEAVTAHMRNMRSAGKITADQTWRDMGPEFAARILKNPAGFLKQVNGGKAVTA